MMDATDIVKRSIARVISPSNGVTRGTAFTIVAGYMLTCWHVIEDLDVINILFEESRESITATLVLELSNSQMDIAVLSVSEPHPAPVLLSLEYQIGDAVWSYGYQYQQSVTSGYPVSGTLSGNTKIAKERSLIVVSGTDFQQGISGAPLLQRETGQVIGMISARFHEKGVGFAIPIATVLACWPDLTEHIQFDRDRVIAEIATLFELLGYEVKTHKILEYVPPLDIYGEIHIGFTNIRTAISCIQSYEAVVKEQLMDFAFRICSPLYASKYIETAFVVSVNNQPFTKDAMDFAQSMGIRVITFQELEGNLISFSRYINGYLEDFENHERFVRRNSYPLVDQLQWQNLYKYYISLKCRDILQSEAKPINLDEVVAAWLQDPVGRHLAILGDYGAGKTSFCLHLTYTVAKAYQQSPTSNRIPLFFALRDYNPHTTLSAFILEKLAQYQLLVNDYRAFEKMVQAGRLLLIFDGFDELAESTDQQTALSRFRELSRLARGKSKVILTCRSHYFKTEEQSINLLLPEIMTPFMLELSRTEHYSLFELQGLDENQILELIAKHTENNLQSYWDDIKSIYDLADLASRPILLTMILQTLPQLRQLHGQVNSTSLYNIYTKYWLERDKWRSVLSIEDKFHFAEELAWQMFIHGRLTVHYDDLLSRIEAYFQGRYTYEQIAHTLDTDIRTSSFLTRDKAGYFTFIHKSFMEFLTARKLAQEIGRGQFDNLGQKLVPHAILTFLKDLLKPEGIEQVKAVIIQSGYSEVIKGVCMDILLFLGITITEVPWMFSVSFSSDGKYLATGHADCKIRIWEVEQLARPPFVLSSHSSWVRSVQYSPMGTYLASCGWDNHVKIWRTIDWSLAHDFELEEKMVSVCFSPDEKLLAAGGFDRMIHLWETTTGKPVCNWRGHYGVVWDLCFNSDGTRIASACTDKIVRIRNTATGEIEAILVGHEDAVSTVCFSKDDRLLLSGDWLGELIAWNYVTQSILYRRQAHTNKIGEISVNADGKHFVSSGDDLKVRIWSIEAAELVHVFSDPTYFLPAVQYSLNGHLIGCGGFDQVLRIWDAHSWTLLQAFKVE